MSAEETKHLSISGSCYSETAGRTNPGFDDPLRRDHNSITDSHGRDQPADWKKIANDTLEDYLSRCPGSYGLSGQPSSSGQAAANQCDPSVKVCYLIVKFELNTFMHPGSQLCTGRFIMIKSFIDNILSGLCLFSSL